MMRTTGAASIPELAFGAERVLGNEPRNPHLQEHSRHEGSGK